MVKLLKTVFNVTVFNNLTIFNYSTVTAHSAPNSDVSQLVWHSSQSPYQAAFRLLVEWLIRPITKEDCCLPSLSALPIVHSMFSSAGWEDLVCQTLGTRMWRLSTLVRRRVLN
jgi:hypothetical protein